MNLVSNVDSWNTNVECLRLLSIEQRMISQLMDTYVNFVRKYAP